MCRGEMCEKFVSRQQDGRRSLPLVLRRLLYRACSGRRSGCRDPAGQHSRGAYAYACPSGLPLPSPSKTS
ncbi:unnamed protein product [Vitrella brassicaformis CCMP3155]|uniref:Uncharacterized protein n=1 Tax=Vitrella brassicaformis (strain CCMP3155) TaxID=1169540 RepID=A0A0G4GE64_VITBC|nr:unnamed protein product [Vitrella brassicaformis CCMP3155]|eukprot:CEM27655.1 unnamed protein product [Vitrella brassicaformis CCMP3155]